MNEKQSKQKKHKNNKNNKNNMDRREQNRNAAARSRARKNAMISKVIQLHQENMGLRAFVAQNITETKNFREKIKHLQQLLMQQQQYSMMQYQQQMTSLAHHQQQQQPTTTATETTQQQSSLFDIINQPNLFQNEQETSQN